MSSVATSKKKGKGKAPSNGAGRPKPRLAKRAAYEEELRDLEESIAALNPASTSCSKFADLPLSRPTLEGLQSAFFHTLTPIQAKSIPYALKRKDILGAARTGSGKTLAFLVPLLETLYRNKWGPADGLGALVISPTRELAVQIFEVLRKIGAKHTFSAGLVIGGKNLKDEQERLSRMNILIATPGRLLQHLDQTLSFDTSNLQLLVLDEADRILDMGFSKSLDAIIQNLPPSTVRQTLLFSATQTNSIQSLARLSLRDPVYVSVRDAGMASSSSSPFGTGKKSSNTAEGLGHDASDGDGPKTLETPKGLEQHYMIVDLDKKLDTLWSFIKSHMACKTLVFMSSGKQVRFAYEAFRHLRPGIPLLHIHGKQKQAKRLEIYSRFMSSDKCVLFATDIAARGLDFPSVSWVVQLDCPEDVDTYVHRVGRTARYNSKGKALLLLLPSEQKGFLKRLKEKKLDDKVSFIRANQAKQQTIQKQFQSLAFQFPEIKFLAQRSFISYIKSVHLQKDKTVFKLDDLPLDRYAKSLGLAGTPKIKFVSKKEANARKNKARELAKLAVDGEDAVAASPLAAADDDDEDEEENSDESHSDAEGSHSGSDDDEVDEKIRGNAPQSTAQAKAIASKTTKYDKMYKHKNQGVLSEHYGKVIDHDGGGEEGNGASKASASLLGADDDQEDFITLARPAHGLDDDDHDGETERIPMNDDSIDHEDLSKRRQKLGVTKKGLLKLRGQGEKLVFDEEGKAHAIYELIGEDQIGDVEAERRAFVEEQARMMQDIDTKDKEAIRALRREKKRLRKEREREVRLGNKRNNNKEGAGLAVVAGFAGDDDDDEEGVKEIDFDLPPLSEDGQDDDDDVGAGQYAWNTGPASTKRKRGDASAGKEAEREASGGVEQEEEDLEALALRALKKGRK